jgi:SAM-dependent methyltransferase
VLPLLVPLQATLPAMKSTRTARVRRKVGYGLAVGADLALRASRRATAAPGGTTLEGDRWVEWSFCMARMADGDGTTMDFGADLGFLSLAAAQRGHRVVALDREDIPLLYEHERVTRVTADILDRPLADRHFDQIVNCSSVEHVGLGGRYGSGDQPDGDLEAMEIMADMLAGDGRMILTIPVGRDAVFGPQHRVYGDVRMPRLLERYRPLEEQYWHKVGAAWSPTDRATALATEGSESFYSLGLFVLGRG